MLEFPSTSAWQRQLCHWRVMGRGTLCMRCARVYHADYIHKPCPLGTIEKVRRA